MCSNQEQCRFIGAAGFFILSSFIVLKTEIGINCTFIQYEIIVGRNAQMVDGLMWKTDLIPFIIISACNYFIAIGIFIDKSS